MNCQFPDEVLKAVISYLRRTGKTVTRVHGEYALADGVLNVGTIKRAFSDRAISVQEDGSILICGVSVPCEWDAGSIRRRIEGYLRKSASNEEIIRIAACLGLRLK
jgi:hypothetical protein